MIYTTLRHVQAGTEKTQLRPHLQPGPGCEFSSFLSSTPGYPLHQHSTQGRALVTAALLRSWNQLSDLSTRSLLLTLSQSIKLPPYLTLLFCMHGGAQKHLLMCFRDISRTFTPKSLTSKVLKPVLLERSPSHQAWECTG